MPLERVYKSGSIVYFESDKADHVFVLRSGAVTLISISPETGSEARETIKSGEFFGVKSALARLPREETAQVLQDSDVLVFTTQEFEALAMKNHKLVMKMLKVFSNQLRHIGKRVQNILKSDQDDDSGNGLFLIGEHFLKNKKFTQALYAYKKYLEHYPDGEYCGQCRQRIEMASSGASTGYAIASDGTSFVETSPEASAEEELQSADDTVMASTKSYYDGISLYSQGQYQEALKMFKKVIEDPENVDFHEKAMFEFGRCLMNLGKAQEAITSFTSFLQQYAGSDMIKDVLFLIGKNYVQLENVEKASTFFKKVASMPPKEKINKKAEKELQALPQTGDQ